MYGGSAKEGIFWLNFRARDGLRALRAVEAAQALEVEGWKLLSWRGEGRIGRGDRLTVSLTYQTTGPRRRWSAPPSEALAAALFKPVFELAWPT